MRAEPERAQNEIGGAAEGTDDSGDQEEIRCSRQCGLPDAEALVTDESCFSDFPLKDADYRWLSRQYGFEVGKYDRIAAIGERLVGLRC